MKILLALGAFVVVVTCVKCASVGPEIEIPHLVGKYCALPVKGREHYRFCVRENKIGQHLDFARNCAQQIKYNPIFHELEKFVCHTRTEAELLYFLKCYVPALTILHVDDQKTLPVIRKCLAYGAVRGLKKTGHQAIPHDITYF